MDGSLKVCQSMSGDTIVIIIHNFKSYEHFLHFNNELFINNLFCMYAIDYKKLLLELLDCKMGHGLAFIDIQRQFANDNNITHE